MSDASELLESIRCDEEIRKAYQLGQLDQAEKIATQLLGIDEISSTNREMCHTVRQLTAELQQGYLEVQGQ